jgi:uncharacterized membrane protein YqjE
MDEVNLVSEAGNRELEPGAPETPTADGIIHVDRESFRHYSSLLLMIVGLCLIGVFLAYWAADVVKEQQMGVWVPGPGPREVLIWRVLASAINLRYLYAIVGTILCLLAIHTTGRENWRKAVPAFMIFAALNAIMLILGFIGLVFVLDWDRFWGEYHVAPVFSIILFLVNVSAFIAIIVAEPWQLPRSLRSRPWEETETEPDDDQSEPSIRETEPEQ